MFGYKVHGKHTFPNMSAEHDVLTAHLMRQSMFHPYIYGLGSECCLLYYFTKPFAYCNFVSPVLLQTSLLRESSEIPRLLSIFR